MDKLHINVSAEGIRALDHLSVALNDRNQQMRLTLRQLREVFEDNAPGLGAHTAEIELLLDELEDLAATAAQNNQRLAKKAARAGKPIITRTTSICPRLWVSCTTTLPSKGSVPQSWAPARRLVAIGVPMSKPPTAKPSPILTPRPSSG